MENLTKRFNNPQQGGDSIYHIQLNEKKTEMNGGGKSRKLSPCSENWKKKYLEMKINNENLKKENKRLTNENKRLKKKKIK
tara:strand:- start:813 stop:1055 length:243 start_codon:yes stop_codon:yes gene_type:complete